MITVLGAGAFGTSLAVVLAQKGPVTLWARDADHVATMRSERENKIRLQGVRLPEAISVTDDIRVACQSQTILLAVPMQQLASFLTMHAEHLAGKSLVAACKGLDLDTLTGPVDLIHRHVPQAGAAKLTGPGFAQDIAAGLPTAMTLACQDDALGRHLQEQLNTPSLRLYRTRDVTGAELAGALKNVIAIGAGVVMGAALGVSARAALIARGFAEMQRLAEALGGQAETLAGLSGIGDLTLTCTSEQSRNFRFGAAIGKGEAFDQSITVEGAATARAAHKLAQSRGLDLPITAAIVALLDDPTALKSTIDALLSRPLKSE